MSPRGTRQILNTHVDQALNDLKRFCANLTLVVEAYESVHPELSLALKQFIAAAEKMAVALIDFQLTHM